MTSEEKFEEVHRQCKEMWLLNKPLPIRCPYCENIVDGDDGPCCQLLDKAVRAIIERAQQVDQCMESYKRREFGRMIMDGRSVN